MSKRRFKCPSCESEVTLPPTKLTEEEGVIMCHICHSNIDWYWSASSRWIIRGLSSMMGMRQA